ncbi:UDP-glucose/GDP-mannose dehydrogenase family protein [Yinghuangia aomiensis]|uniref:UDP-glucose 6-dehydrogenase n=1 Tax=Yinghuangia aomiensis TaxID=676205 RepID=A0ABP9I4Y1_9ACTN
MKLSVIGTGYVGAVHAACMAVIGHEVLGVDTDAAKIAELTQGRPPFYEPGLAELLNRTVRSGRLNFTTSFAEAAAFSDTHFVCVGTPQQPGSLAADLRFLDAAVDALTAEAEGPCLVVGKSTVPVGTAERLANRLRDRDGNGAHEHPEIAWNPEFLREGFAVKDTLTPARLVVGVRSPSADRTLRKVYRPMVNAGVPFISTDPATAELLKVASNAFLATKISFINTMAELCEASGADVVTLANALGEDPRIGHPFLSAGLGFGGSCLPKDIRALSARAEELGVREAVTFLRQIDEINLRQRQRTVDLARTLLGGAFAGRNVAVLGAAFKPDSDDVRDSPALAVAAEIHREGAHVRVHDPEALANARLVHPELDYAATVHDVCDGADIVLHLTEWDLYRGLDPRTLVRLVHAPIVVDARNTLDPVEWRAAGWTVRALGRQAALGTPDAHGTAAEPEVSGNPAFRIAATGLDDDDGDFGPFGFRHTGPQLVAEIEPGAYRTGRPDAAVPDDRRQPPIAPSEY